ncbi:flagellin N-terminal helical domain-containing protein [Dongia rigui]|uniref:Flagellin n=1 Tax=Dongia rigui TaxID=940149 RepID=A0ABU5DUB0_9PROT|nr:flagellin [Dongia rigui]MDY0870545.1 flagellin [Dongia rigui]
MAQNEVQLAAGTRSNLLLLQNTTTKLERTQLRLATGNKINSALEGPAQFFAAKGLNQRAGDLNSLKDGIGQAISTIKSADTGITNIEKLVEQARGLTTQALGSLGTDASSVSLRNSLANQYNTLLRQIDRLAADSGYQGKNLLIGSGLTIDATSSSKAAVNALSGIGNAITTNVVSADKYKIAVTGDGAISGSSADIARAQTDRGISNLEINGFASTTNANYDSVIVKLSGGTGKDKTFTVSEGDQTVTQTFTNLDWQIAKSNGVDLRFSTKFTSGTVVSFNIDFEAIEDVPDTAGVGTSVIEKNVNLQLQVTNQNGEIITRDGLNLLGQGKLANGENAFAFDSGTARLTVDERQLLQSSKYNAAVGAAYGTGSNAIASININSITAVSADYNVSIAVVGTSFNYTENNFQTFSVVAHAVGSTSATVTVVVSVGATNSVENNFAALVDGQGASIAFNYGELKFTASAAAAAASEVSTTLTGVDFSIGAVAVHSAESFADNTVTSVNITITATSTSATFQYTDEFGGTASKTVTLSGFSNAAAIAVASLTFSVQGGLNSGAVFVLSLSANTLFQTTGQELNFKVRGEFTAERPIAFDVRKANTGGTAVLSTKQATDASDANNLAVQLNEANTSNVTVVSQNVQTNGQGLRLDFAQNGWNDRSDIDNAIKQLDAAKLSLRAASSNLSTNLNIIQTREDYTKEFSDVLTEGASKLVAADQNEEGANILTLQTRQQLGTISLSLANQAQQAILRLF